MKHEQMFKDFLTEEVNLNMTRRNILNDHVTAVTKALDDLEGYRSFEKQGSFALGTIIKPKDSNDEYDADLTILMDNNSTIYSSPKSYIEGVYDYLKRNGTYKDKIKRKKRCVRVNYNDDCHLDLVPCVKYQDSLWICNWETDQFEITDGTGYREWFLQKNSQTDGNLRRVVRLVKFLRDHKNTFTAPSIILTTLMAQEVSPGESSENFKTIPDTLDILTTGVSNFLKNNSTIPIILNPALPIEEFSSPTQNRHWNETQYKNFRTQFISLSDRISEAIAESDKNKSIQLWKGLYGEKFALNSSTNSVLSSTRIKQSATPKVAFHPDKPWLA